MPVFNGGFRVREVAKNKKALKKFKMDKVKQGNSKKRDKGYCCPSK